MVGFFFVLTTAMAGCSSSASDEAQASQDAVSIGDTKDETNGTKVTFDADHVAFESDGKSFSFTPDLFSGDEAGGVERIALAAAHPKEKVVAIVVNAGYMDEVLLLDIAKSTPTAPSFKVLEMPKAGFGSIIDLTYAADGKLSFTSIGEAACQTPYHYAADKLTSDKTECSDGQ